MSDIVETLNEFEDSKIFAIAKKLKIKEDARQTKSSVIRKIMQQPEAFVASAIKDVETEVVKEIVSNTKEQVLEAIDSILKAKPEFKAQFPEDGTWIFSYNGAQDSGNLQIPLRTIKTRAEIVARGSRRPRALLRDGTYKGYADSVLTA